MYVASQRLALSKSLSAKHTAAKLSMSHLTDTAMTTKEAIVIGGGLAGIAAAVRLIQAGVKPTLVERRPFLGGRAFSFTDRETGEQVDNGQHVILGACTEYLKLLEKLGQSEAFYLPTRLEFPVVYGGRTAKFRNGRILGIFSAIIGYSHLSLIERLGVLKCGLKLRMMDSATLDSQELKNMSFESWLRQKDQDTNALRRFWALFIVPIFNSAIDQVAAYDAIVFIREVMFGRSKDSAIGVPLAGLSEIMGSPAAEYLARQGGELLAGQAAMNIKIDDSSGFVIALSSGLQLKSQTVVCAVTPDVLGTLLPESLAELPFFQPLNKIQTTPIVGVNIWYESPIISEPLVSVLQSDLQWVFNLSLIRGSQKNRPHQVAVSLSDAGTWMTMDKQDVRKLILEAMADVFPRARRSKVIKAMVVKSRAATIKVLPGASRTRLGHKTPVPGLFLAGDWTDTGMPATMEGAVRSGNIAADAALEWTRSESR